ncbi:MAG: enoyl-CoA hydratase/isomerase family protein [Acidimicrobiales bacterium]|nr:enoyl-CoA hydratase/isomerase family protein [Acidimicrobiales bacterium]
MNEMATNAAGQPILLRERRGHVGIVAMNRPEARNAMSPDLAEALVLAWEEQEADDDIWVHIITGVGTRAFCAGADLKLMAVRNAASPADDPAGPVIHSFGGIGPAISKPVIAAVNGFALGGGCELCLACDLVVMEEHAEMGLPEVLRGVVAGAGGLERLPRRIPPAIALEAILTGTPFSASRAYELGLVNRVVPTGSGLDAAVELAEAICQASPLAVRYSRAVARASFSLGETAAKGEALDLRKKWRSSEDFKEGPRAFAEKRSPEWSGR